MEKENLKKQNTTTTTTSPAPVLDGKIPLDDKDKKEKVPVPKKGASGKKKEKKEPKKNKAGKRKNDKDEKPDSDDKKTTTSISPYRIRTDTILKEYDFMLPHLEDICMTEHAMGSRTRQGFRAMMGQFTLIHNRSVESGDWKDVYTTTLIGNSIDQTQLEFGGARQDIILSPRIVVCSSNTIKRLTYTESATVSTLQEGFNGSSTSGPFSSVVRLDVTNYSSSTALNPQNRTRGKGCESK